MRRTIEFDKDGNMVYSWKLDDFSMDPYHRLSKEDKDLMTKTDEVLLNMKIKRMEKESKEEKEEEELRVLMLKVLKKLDEYLTKQNNI
jgi:hypothetical protein